MAVLAMEGGGGGGEDIGKGKPFLHDFLGGGGASRKRPLDMAAPAAESGGGSERRGVINSEVFQFHGRKTALSRPEVGNTISASMRSNSEPENVGAMRGRMLRSASDSLQNSHLTKMFGKEVVDNQSGKSHDGEITCSMQPPYRLSSVILHPSISQRAESPTLGWERSVPMSSGQVIQYPSHLAPPRTYVEKNSFYKTKNATTSPAFLSQSAADEGSRTGMKGSGILKILNPVSGVGERQFAKPMPSIRPQVTHIVEPAVCNMSSHLNSASAGRQMTIFYDGQAHVFDSVHPNKADVILALAGSSGESWTTAYPVKPHTGPFTSEARALGGEKEIKARNPLSSEQQHSETDPTMVAVVKNPSDLFAALPGIVQGGLSAGDVEGKRNI